MEISNEQLTEIIRLAYLKGGTDQQEDSFQWCAQGSREVAEEILPDLLEDSKQS